MVFRYQTSKSGKGAFDKEVTPVISDTRFKQWTEMGITAICKVIQKAKNY